MSNYDMGVDLDFDDIKTVADEGMYLLRCVDAEIRQTKGKEDNPDARNLFLYWEILKPEEWIGAPNPLDVLSLSKKMRRVLKERLEGMTGKPWDKPGMRIVPREFIGQFAWAALVKDTYNGRELNKIREYFPDSANTAANFKAEDEDDSTEESAFPWLAQTIEPSKQTDQPLLAKTWTGDEPF